MLGCEAEAHWMSRITFLTLGLVVGFIGSVGSVACSDEPRQLGGTAGSGNTGTGASGGAAPERIDEILALTGDVGSGESLFPPTCGTGAPPCHQEDGTSGGGLADDLTSVTGMLTDEAIVEVILNGKNQMPPQAGLPNQDIADILAYMRAVW
jgi:mono/diheme cytochrome c family protein